MHERLTAEEIAKSFANYKPEIPSFTFPKRYSRAKRARLRAKAIRIYRLRYACGLIAEDITRLSVLEPTWLRDLIVDSAYMNASFTGEEITNLKNN